MNQLEVEAWVESWKERLLPNWTLVVLWPKHLEDGELRASIDTSDHYDSSVIRIDPGWTDGWKNSSPPGSDPEVEVETAIVHELLHAALRDVETVVGHVREEFLSPEGAKWLTLAFDHAEEGFIERLARLLVHVGSVR